MRKTLRTAVGTLLGTVLVSATMAVSAPPAFADDCAGAVPLDARTETGTISATTPARWLAHDSTLDSRVVTLATPGGAATLEVRDATCSTVLCTDRSSATETAACTIEGSGTAVIGVVRDTGIVYDGPQVFEYVTTVLDTAQMKCNDGLDNDGDGWTDYPADAECTSALDNTEAPIRVAAYGHITIETDAAGRPQMTLSGVFARPETYRCGLVTSPTIEVVCRQVPNTEFLYTCTHFVLTAEAFSASKPLGPGSAKGYVKCDSPAVLTTDDVDSSESLVKVAAVADNVKQKIDLGTGMVVRCRAMGIKGADNATGNYMVDCWEPGVAWPTDDVDDPRD